MRRGDSHVSILEKSFLPGSGGRSALGHCAFSWSCNASNSRKRRFTCDKSAAFVSRLEYLHDACVGDGPASSCRYCALL